jgi:Uncharacterized protein conserved in bacteria (DUF2252)
MRPLVVAATHSNHGERVVLGKRLIQSATDIFAGFTSVAGNDAYERQFRDMKVIPDAELIVPRLAQFATAWARRWRAPTPTPATRSRLRPTSARGAGSTTRSQSLPSATRTRPPATTNSYPPRSKVAL